MASTQTRKKVDPPVRKDRLCARHPECTKPLHPPTKNSGWQDDPFCSTGCCRIYWDHVENSRA